MIPDSMLATHKTINKQVALGLLDSAIICKQSHPERPEALIDNAGTADQRSEESAAITMAKQSRLERKTYGRFLY